MCGGFKASRIWLRGKEAQIEAEMKRLANLKEGFTYSWPLITGLREAYFGGHVRSENLDSIWAGKVKEHVKIAADSYSERNTVGGDRHSMVEFNMKPGKAIHGVITNKNELRIVTEPAQGSVAAVHHRQPQLVDL